MGGGGDIVGVDFGCFKDGFCGDSARTIAIGKVSPEAQKLMDATRQSLELAIEQCREGNRLQDIGWAVQSGRIPLSGTVLLVSGRASFELTQKAVMAGVPVLAAVSAPSSLAVDLASQSGLTLVAFLRGDSMNVYARPDRVVR